jgi:hypothetical protein
MTTHFLQTDDVLIPHDSSATTVNCVLHGANFTSGLQVLNSAGVLIGTISGIAADHFTWVVPRDAYAAGASDYFHVVLTDGQFSNSWQMVWA